MTRLALIGDYDANKTAHLAIPRVLERARRATGVNLDWEWIGTDRVFNAAETLAGFSGVWMAPGSPYRDLDGALTAIRHAREHDLPFLGTCGGFQHALIEFARNVAELAGADHAETNAGAPTLVVTPLACSLVDQMGSITFTPGSRMNAIFGGQPAHEGYHCNYGVNPTYRTRLETAGLRFTGFDATGDIRAFELPGRRFFLGTLFQPERSALRDAGHSLVEAFVAAVGA